MWVARWTSKLVLTCVCVLAGESGVCSGPVGGAAAGAGVLAEQESRTWKHPKRQASTEEHDQLVM